MHSRFLTLIIFHLIQQILATLQHSTKIIPLLSFHKIHADGNRVTLLGLCVQFSDTGFLLYLIPTFTTLHDKYTTSKYDHVMLLGLLSAT